MAAAAINSLRDLPHKLKSHGSTSNGSAPQEPPTPTEKHHSNAFSRIRSRGSHQQGTSSSASSQKSGHRSAKSAKEEAKQHDIDLRHIVEWEADSHTLGEQEIVKRGEQKHVGFSSHTLKVGDFELVKTLGTGTFARVWLATLKGEREKERPKVFALKILRKADVIRLKQVEHVRNERNVLSAVAGHPFITTLVTSFKDNDTLYMLLDYCPGGEVFSYLRRARTFPEETSRFYAAEIILILSFLHEHLGVAYRDLKPENILVDSQGHLRLVDFGFAKKIGHKETYTLCGTPEYLAPEVIRNTGHGSAVDWWALGILIYEFLCGQPPFWDNNPLKIYEQIVEGHIQYPSSMPAAAKDIVQKLCKVDTSKRLGNMAGRSKDVKEHAWFRGVKWEDLYYRRGEYVRGPIVPEVKGVLDTSCFDEYEDESGEGSRYTEGMREKWEKSFADF